MLRLHRAAVAAGIVALALVPAACSSATGGTPAHNSDSSPGSYAPLSTLPSGGPSSTSSVPDSSTPGTSTPVPPPTSSASSPPPAQGAQLPMGGTKVLGHYRIVAFYGGPGSGNLGVLGSRPPDAIAGEIESRARQFRGYGLPVQPAMELISTVAQGSPGPDGLYSAPIPDADVAQYLAAAHRHHMLLILDFQPGRGEFLPQVEHFKRFIADPSVSVALDPEWKMGPGEIPGQVIGSASASSVNAVRDWMSRLIARRNLPDKLLLVHQFRTYMLPDRSNIRPKPGVEIVFHADGFGTQGAKLNTWRTLAFPGRPFGTGFKLFLTQDTDLMSPAQVMALHPRPDIVTFQ